MIQVTDFVNELLLLQSVGNKDLNTRIKKNSKCCKRYVNSLFDQMQVFFLMKSGGGHINLIIK